MTNINLLLGLRVLVVGLGREGTALAVYLAKHSVQVTATDKQSAPQLDGKLALLQNTGVPCVLGEHPLSLLDEADILFVSPGVPLEIPFLQEAVARKIPLCTESKLFCYLCPAPIMAITGSSGKTTTTTLLSKIMQAEGRQTWVGGNIGRALIEDVDQIKADDVVVLELSSFQLEYFHARLNKEADIDSLPTKDVLALTDLLGNWSPPIAAILNITPNHLDRHPSMKQYVRAKRALIEYQGTDEVIVMSLDNDMTRTIGHQFEPKVRWFSLEAQRPGGAGLVDDTLVLFNQNGQSETLANKQDIKLRGTHNLYNILAACLMAKEAGVSIEAMQQVITSFTGVEHRLQPIRELNQVSYYNDSIATSPERLLAALNSFSEPIVLLAGGRDKYLPWEETARVMLHKTRQLVLFGEAIPIIMEAIETVKDETAVDIPTIYHCVNLTDAVEQAIKIAQAGDVVLLSPGCASFDEFRDFAERGERFKSLVDALGN